MKLEKHILRVKTKSLVAESKIIKGEVAKIRNSEPAGERRNAMVNSLLDHKINVVGVEARATGLALAYIKGMPYHCVENKRNEAREIEFVNRVLPKVVNMLKKYHNYSTTSEKVSAWINA